MAHRSVRWLIGRVLVGGFFVCWMLAAAALAQNAGPFEGQTDVGSVTPPGTGVCDAAGTCTLTAAGANLWSTVDGFHFLWKKMPGDVAITADITFPETAGEHNPHRKAVLMFRQSLAADAAYADAAQHGSGLTALQYRRAAGAVTQDVELNIAPPRRVRLEKRGDIVTMYLSLSGEPLHPVGASIPMHLADPFYAGIGLSSHDASKVERAVFSRVTVEPLAPLAAAGQPGLISSLETVGVDPGAPVAQVVLSAAGRFEAPNWSRDGKTLIFNEGGRIMIVPVAGGTPQPLNVGDATRCGGSHGLSPDGRELAITCSTPGKPESRVYIVPFPAGGEPRLLTPHPNSYFHTWSPDGKTIVFTRPGPGGSGNIMAIPAEGGEEHALTTGTGISDDPDYAPDGQYIYFNSDRGGSMQIWRMRPDGSGAEQMTNDEEVNWTPHPSPDGKWVVFVSYPRGTTGHPVNRAIELRLLSVADRSVRVAANVVGGSGTMNVGSWAPDGRHFAFVGYQVVPQ